MPRRSADAAVAPGGAAAAAVSAAASLAGAAYAAAPLAAASLAATSLAVPAQPSTSAVRLCVLILSITPDSCVVCRPVECLFLGICDFFNKNAGLP